MAIGGTGASTTATSVPSLNAQALVVVSPIFEVPRDVEIIMICGSFTCNLGTGVSSMIATILRGGVLGSPIVGLPVRMATLPSLTMGMSICVVETVIGLATVQYCLVQQSVGATSGDQVNGGSIALLAFL
jgi:hypothetical protein